MLRWQVAAAKAGSITTIVVAVKNSLTVGVISALMTLPMSLAGISELIGLHWLAFGSALLGVVVRIIKNRIPLEQGWRELVALPIVAFAFAVFHPKWIDGFVGELPPSEAAMMLGFGLGFAPTFLAALVIDTIKSLMGVKEASK